MTAFSGCKSSQVHGIQLFVFNDRPDCINSKILFHLCGKDSVWYRKIVRLVSKQSGADLVCETNEWSFSSKLWENIVIICQFELNLTNVHLGSLIHSLSSFFNLFLFYTVLFNLCLLTLNQPKPKVISLCHQYKARPACTSVQSDQALCCWLTNFKCSSGYPQNW